MLAAAAELEGVDEVFPISARTGEGLDGADRAAGRADARGPLPLPARGPQRPVERGAAGRADPRAGAEPHPRGDPALGRGLGQGDRRARGRPGHGPRRDLGGDRVPEGDPDRQGRAPRSARSAPPPAARSKPSWAPRSTSTSRSASAAAGAATRTCSTASASSRRAARPLRLPRCSSEVAIRRARPGAVRGPGLRHRRGADARLHERGVAAADRRDRRGPLLQPLARGDLAQGGDLGQRPAAAPAPLRLRRRRDRRPGRAGRARLPHRRAQLLLPRARRRDGDAGAAASPTRRWRRWSGPCAAAPPSGRRAATR